MSICAQDLLTAADDYKNKCAANEADFRGAISRAYYACYHGANEFQAKIASPGITKANCGVHENTLHMLNHPSVPNTDPDHIKSKLIGQLYKGVLFNRRAVDYDLNATITQNNVNVAFANANKIFQKI